MNTTPPAPLTENTDTKKPRVLFVDDEELILKFLVTLFKNYYDVHIANSGARALEMLEHQHFHVIVSDQRMPGMKGTDLLLRAKAIAPRTVRVLLTGYADLSAAVAALNEAEVFRYLTKPWQNRELQETLATAVEAGLALEAAHQTPFLSSVVDIHEGSRDDLIITPGDLLTSKETPVVFVESDSSLFKTMQAEGYPDLYLVNTVAPQTALDALQRHHALVVVVAIDGRDTHNVHFLHLLKRELPHVVSIVISDAADGSTVIDMINTARVFRGMFRPIRPGVLRLFIKSAQRQAQQLHTNPATLSTQQPASSWQVPPKEGTLSSLLMQKLKSLKRMLVTWH